MRPKVDYSTKERLVKVARGLDSDLEGRSVPFGEALDVVLGHVEAERTESEESGEITADFTIGRTPSFLRGDDP